MSRSESGQEAAAERVPEYASTRLIAYIGNKRALLPFLRGVFLEEAARLGAASPIRFLDPFAGSGAASRLARSLGWRVAANDAEEYSRAVNEAWLGVSADDLPGLFAAEGGPAAAFAALNALHPSVLGLGSSELLPEPEPYMARHYAPVDTGRADWRRERLFFTRENAVFLDRARCAIDYLRPRGGDGPARAERAARSERALLLGALLYEAATHANTSGVFKAYHKGFGGHGRDALGRILSPMSLEVPLLWGGPPSEVARGDAAEFCASRPADLCYLDPPYNQHQYGSNYHILNTLARWTRSPVSEERGSDGRFLSVSGIPGDWAESRSPYCSRSAAAAAFRGLVASIDAGVIALSYNSDGIVEPEELYDLLSDRAEVSMRSVEYVAYRGGRQSASRRSATSEILFVARRREGASRGTGAAGSMRGLELAALRARMELGRVLAGPYDPDAFERAAGGFSFSFPVSGGGTLELQSYRGLVLETASKRACADLAPGDAESLARLLGEALATDHAAACAAAASAIEAGAEERRAQDLALSWLRKLAHRRYETQFGAAAARLAAVASARPEALQRLASGVRDIEELFARRLEGRGPLPRSYQETTRTEDERAAPGGRALSQSKSLAFGPRTSLATKTGPDEAGSS
jgi:adenine-specific DNA-methyltransferase